MFLNKILICCVLLESPPDVLTTLAPKGSIPPELQTKRESCHKGRTLSSWYPRAESNRQRCFRRALLYPFNYEDMLSCEKSEVKWMVACSPKAYNREHC